MPLNLFSHGFLRQRTNILRLLGIAILVEWMTHASPHSLWSLSDWDHLIGLTLITSGLAIRSWAAGHIVKTDVLAVHGPYAWVRHPLYLGSLLLLVGFAELLEDRLALVGVLLMFGLFYLPAMVREDRRLRDHFGQTWVSYKKDTPQWIPNRWSKSSKTPQPPWNLYLWVNNGEWRIVTLSIFVVIALQIGGVL